MLNFIRFDIKKLFLMRGFWIALIIFVLFCGMTLIIDSMDYHATFEDYQTSQTALNEMAENEGSGDIRIEVESTQNLLTEEEYLIYKEQLRERMTITDFSLSSYGITIVIAYIFFALFVGNDFSSGYLKNMLALRGAKWKWVTSKIVVAVVFNLVMYLVALGFGVLYEISAGQFPAAINLGHLVLNFLLYSLLFILIMLLNVALLLIFQSKVTIMVVSTLLSMGLHINILNQIGNLTGLDLTSYFYSIRLQNMGMDYQGLIIPALVSGLISFLLLYSFNRWYVYRVDFKFES
ncbi:hypothetical protein [Fundicoccus culcitae]|uniref:ABC transporter permease n=1 Tax=Fundicoccus culcitae TaxID=2969821 RepID=A0ABY5P8E4_9LACT|nr:hypothetical protein [Fundicoccus culcitae]UUX34939.1 hypothetical protein NRE15_04645 [Fundicoccus culcitae]